MNEPAKPEMISASERQKKFAYKIESQIIIFSYSNETPKCQQFYRKIRIRKLTIYPVNDGSDYYFKEGGKLKHCQTPKVRCIISPVSLQFIQLTSDLGIRLSHTPQCQ